mgnify:FL=1
MYNQGPPGVSQSSGPPGVPTPSGPPGVSLAPPASAGRGAGPPGMAPPPGMSYANMAGGALGSGGASSSSGDVGEPPNKRGKAEASLVPESKFILEHPGLLKQRVQCPTGGDSEWNLQGQVLSFELHPNDSIAALKEAIRTELGGKMPVNKMKVNVDGLGFLKDNLSVAYYNLDGSKPVVLTIKERGGRRK